MQTRSYPKRRTYQFLERVIRDIQADAERCGDTRAAETCAYILDEAEVRAADGYPPDVDLATIDAGSGGRVPESLPLRSSARSRNGTEG